MPKKPKYRRHSTRDLGFVEHEKKRTYFNGPYRSEESMGEYGDYLRAHGFLTLDRPAPSKTLLLGLLCERYLEWAATTYPDGPRSENANLRGSVKLLIQHTAPTSIASEFTPLKLKAFQGWLAKQKLSRTYINSTISRVRRVFRWAVAEELVAPAVYHALAEVPWLRKDRSPARETAPRQPVAWEHVAAILGELSPTVRAMVITQWLCGVRSQSLCLARPRQFDRSKNPWEWAPRHKSEHLGRQLTLFVGPQAQAVLGPLIDARKPDEYLFQPLNIGGERSKGYRAFYDSVSYLRAISRAIERINVARRKEAREKFGDEKKANELPHWTPHQMRHARATLVREAHGLEAAQAVLGHAKMDMTQLYAKKQLDLARLVALQMG